MRIPRIAELRELASAPTSAGISEAMRQVVGIDLEWLAEYATKFLDWLESIGVTDADLPDRLPARALMALSDAFDAGDPEARLSELVVKHLPAVAAKLVAAQLRGEFPDA